MDKLIFPKRKALVDQKGFTIVELIVTVAIIFVLVAGGVIAYNQYITSSKRTTNESNAKLLSDTLATEATSPSICADDNTLINTHDVFVKNSNNNFLNCASKIIAQSNLTNPYTNQLYGATSSSPLQIAAGYGSTAFLLPPPPDNGAIDANSLVGSIPTGNNVKCSDSLGALNAGLVIVSLDTSKSSGSPPYAVATCDPSPPDGQSISELNKFFSIASP